MQTLYGNQSNNFQQGCQKKLYKFFSFPDIERKSFAFLTKTNAVGLSKLFSTCSQEQFERNNFFKKILNFFYLFRTWAKKFCLSVKFLSIGLSKMYSTNPKEQVDEKYFLRKKKTNEFSNLFGTLIRKKSRLSGKFFSTGLKKLHFTYLQIYFEDNCLKKTFLCYFWTTINFFPL